MDVVAIQGDDDPEDGEIVDEFEDISDCSIPSVGKCDNELLRAISLSSISDSADEKSVQISIHNGPQSQDNQLQKVEGRYCARHRTQYRKRKRKRRLHHDAKRCCSAQSFVVDLVDNSSSSDEELHQDKNMLRNLKEAVHIDNHKEHHNSLRSRLKAMINNVAPFDSDDEEIVTLRTLALLSNSKSDADKDMNDVEIIDDEKAEPELVDILDDKELLELRSAALKSAVLKKHQQRKKRKEQLVEKCIDNTEINKENTTIIDIATDRDKQLNEKTIEIKTSQDLAATPLQKNGNENKDTSVEEDEDIMRANLLASMSKKIMDKIIPIVNHSPQIIPRTQLIVAPNRVLNSLLPKPVFPLPPVKPLIININNDSDSESDVKSPTKKHFEDPISQSVTAFLKLHRQQFEAKENGVGVAVPQSGNPPSNGLVLNTNISNRRDVKLVAKKVVKENDSQKDISGVKLLSKAQQREYQLLKKKLWLAKQKKLVEQIKSSEVKLVESAKKNPHTLKETLADLQVQENGRLRVKGKYDSLDGLLRLVNGASVEWQQCEANMKRLLNELTVAKTLLGQTHRKFTNLVQKLIRAKDNIDARFTKIDSSNSTKFTVTLPILQSILPMATPTTVVTSTPKKSPVQEMKISDIISETNALMQESEPNEFVQENGIKDAIQIADYETNERAGDNVSKVEEIIPTITESFTANTFPTVKEPLKYISPLDSRTSTCDPLGTLCPYELFGDCKDASCKFVHCGKS